MRKKINLLLLLIASCFALFGQVSATSTLNTQDVNQQPLVQEKIYVHTDRDFYITGEIVWFKIYVVTGDSLEMINPSKVAYVEVLNTDQKPVLQAKISLYNGKGDGSFMLPASLGSGTYLLRAYTNWMKNLGPESFFQKPIPIVNTRKRPNWQGMEKPVAYEVQFFPEGGNLVSSLQSTIGFKAVDQFGKGVPCNGFIISEGDTITHFQTFKFGMGRFSFTPQPGKNYKALLQFEDGKTALKELPTASAEGYVMTTRMSDSQQVQVSVAATIQEATVYLVVHAGTKTHEVLKKVLHNNRAEFNLQENQMPEGISAITLLDANQQPVCERLYFKKPAAQLHINLQPNQKTYAPREQVTIAVTTNSGTAQPVTANLSASVFLLDSLQMRNPCSIQSYIWLQSGLKGRIEAPGYYIDSSSKERDDALENLLLTQGWRRFRQPDTVQTEKRVAAFIPEYEGHTVSGRVVNKRTGLPEANVKAYLSVPGNRFQFTTATSAADGSIHFVLNQNYSGEQIIAQTADSALQVEIANPFSEVYDAAPLPGFFISPYFKNQLASRSIDMQAQNAFYKEQQQQFYIPVLNDSSNFFGTPDKRYFLDDYTRFTTMEEVMREYVTEVRLRKSGDRFHYQTQNIPYKTYFEKDPLVLLDGVPVFDINRLIQFDPLKIRKLEVLARKYFLDDLVTEGIVSYTTYSQDLAGFELPANALVLDYEGMQLKREFYAPVYETKEHVQRRLPDFRNLLYWAPQIQTTNTGKTQLRFYTSDLPGTYVIMVQGIGAMGLPGSTATTFTVIK